MISIRNLSIPKKIVAISMIISASSLLLASGALSTYDFFRTRTDLRASTTTLARIVADNVNAAVSFNDQAAAAETLNALRAESSIIAACIYTDEGLFAEILSIAGILVFSGLFAFALSARLHKLVSEPILSLARTANEVSRQKDYSIRATKQSEDELGTLVDSFNEMLWQIRAREADLVDRTAALSQANEELQKANRMKDEFLATLSHELRTPLTAIFGWVNMLQSGRLDEAKTKKAINVIDRNLKAQMQLVDDLLNVSRIITGNLKIRPEWIEAGAIIHAAVDSIQPAATARGIRVVVEIANKAEPVFADPERLQQVLWNLLTNAVKFTDKGGEVKIECGRAGTALQIRVSDTGEGIDPEFMPLLFERFTQADSSKKRSTAVLDSAWLSSATLSNHTVGP